MPLWCALLVWPVWLCSADLASMASPSIPLSSYGTMASTTSATPNYGVVELLTYVVYVINCTRIYAYLFLSRVLCAMIYGLVVLCAMKYGSYFQVPCMENQKRKEKEKE